MASKRQRKKQQKRARQARQAAERQAAKQRQTAERQKQYEKREQAKQAERQARQTAERKQAERKQHKKSARREWLENAFKQRADEANAILREFDKDGTRQVLNDDYGGMLSDDDIMTKSGFFRSNASKLTNKQLEQRISLLDSFLSDASAYREDAKQIKDIADKLGIIDPDNLQIFGDFMEFMRSVLGDRLEPSDVIKDIVVARINRGEDFDDIKQAFMNAYLNSEDYWDMINQFSDNGVLI